MAFVPMNPRPMLQSLVDNDVIVRLKWATTEYTGRLVAVDGYMNIQLSQAEEWEDGVSRGVLGQVLIRCNNVLWISAKKQGLKNERGQTNGGAGMKDDDDDDE